MTVEYKCCKKTSHYLKIIYVLIFNCSYFVFIQIWQTQIPLVYQTQKTITRQNNSDLRKAHRVLIAYYTYKANQVTEEESGIRNHLASNPFSA